MTAERVLVATELKEFSDRVTVPEDIAIVWLHGDEEVPEGDYRGLLPLLSRVIDAAVLDRLPRLAVVANYAVGYDNIDLVAAEERGIPVSNTPDVLTEATADLTWALILAVARRLREADRLARGGHWEGWHPTLLLGLGLQGRTLGILGAGRIGQAVGRRASAFGVELVYWSRSPKPDWEREAGAERIESLETILSRADIVSVHLPLTAESEGLIGGAEFARMKDDAILVNTARGGIVDELALCEALEAGKIFGAGLDVYTDEPHMPERLREPDNLILLPHVGSATREARARMFDVAWANLLRGVRGEPLLTPVTR